MALAGGRRLFLPSALCPLPSALLLFFVKPHQLRLANDVARHRLVEVRFSRNLRARQLDVQGEQFEEYRCSRSGGMAP